MSYLRFAWFYDGTGRPKEEATAYRKAAKLAPPGSTEAYIYLAQAASVVGDYRTAIENYEKALSIDPSNHEAYLGLGNVHNVLGEYEQALAVYTQGPGIPSGG